MIFKPDISTPKNVITFNLPCTPEIIGADSDQMSSPEKPSNTVTIITNGELGQSFQYFPTTPNAAINPVVQANLVQVSFKSCFVFVYKFRHILKLFFFHR